ncbi:MAG: NAD(+) synthase [Opitutales bacterium]|nr:NAD(+) synthase [Opitutales bacterium]MCH8540577.1 NAD(+) synthase [Opitutales bacterium]
MTFLDHSLMRVAAVTPPLRVADVSYNTEALSRKIKQAGEEGASLVVTPELGLTGYTCGDLFAQTTLREASYRALTQLARESRQGPWAIVGLPIHHRSRLYNCLALLAEGKILGIVPKSTLPNTREYYEQRWFTSGEDLHGETMIGPEGPVPFGTDLLFGSPDCADFILGVEVCEDLWSVEPPSGRQALAGATVLINGSASNEILGKPPYRRDLVRQQSARCLAAYLYASSGPGESSTDLVFSGHCLIAENGTLLAESTRFARDGEIILADLDLEQLRHERLTNNTFFNRPSGSQSFRLIEAPLPASKALSQNLPLRRPLRSNPFVPSDKENRAEHCREIFALQTAGLTKRLEHVGCRRVVLGISGGLDSTLALLVCIHSFDQLGWPRQNILAPTMPGFGTSQRTRGNAGKLVSLLGAEGRVISIENVVREHFQAIGHDEETYDVTYENAQARERTQILMDLANKHEGLCIGTGDLSEAALGWCTFNGDHMSMYHVNIGVPKTLVRWIIQWCAEELFDGPIRATLEDIIDTPITPELLPLDQQGGIEQKTEEKVGPYRLHDFFLFYLVRHGFSPQKILFLAKEAFRDEFAETTIRHWLKVFLTRFFRQQFKRSSMPDGPKVGTVALSPRGDWRMPSDACPKTWLRELEE